MNVRVITVPQYRNLSKYEGRDIADTVQRLVRIGYRPSYAIYAIAHTKGLSEMAVSRAYYRWRGTA